MSEITLSSPKKGEYLLMGDIQNLLDNRRSKILLNSKFSPQKNSDSIVFKSEESIEKVVQIVKLASKYINAELKYSDDVNADIKVFHERELLFSEFSEKARAIKNNECVKVEFEAFAQVLAKRMVKRRLYPLQMLSAFHLAFSQNGGNFSVPGAGKTSIVYGAYSFLNSLNEDNPKKVDRLIIVSPLSAFGPWESEFEECFGQKADCKRLNGSLSIDDKRQYFYGNVAEITLISYASIISVKEDIKYLLNTSRVMMVLDEAHKIKNTNGGVISSSIMELAPLCKSRVVLTGTPSPNGYEDIYNLFRFIWPNTDVIKYSLGQLRDMSKNTNDARVPKLIDNIDPFYLRIKKRDLKIPEPIENPPIMVDMKKNQRKIYDFIEERFIGDLGSAQAELHSSLVRAKLIRLQQAASNPALLRSSLTDFSEEYGEDFSLVKDEDASLIHSIMRFYEDEIPAKFEVCAKLIQEIIEKGGKVVVWAIFIDSIRLLSKYLDSLGVENRTLYGETPVAGDGLTADDDGYESTREAIIKEFHNPESSYKVIIANPFAVAESISLHKVCHNAIYLERSFNCAHFVQSKDRIHRYGLPKDAVTNYYYLQSTNSVDETIGSRLKIKEQRMTALMESMPIPLFENVTDDCDEDIKAIIEDYVKRKTV